MFLLVAATAGCGGPAADAPAAAPDTTAPAGPVSPTATEAGCSGGWVDYNADYAATASGSATPPQAVETWLSGEGAYIDGASVEEQAQGLRYTDGEGRTVAEFRAGHAAGGTWLLSSASVCSENFKRD